MTKSRARWVGVEFQPDLTHPQKPVRLGLVLHEVKETGESSFVVIGRMPLLDSRPKEFEHTSRIVMEVASKWVDVMVKQALEGGADNDLFSRLADLWHWNLYLTTPASIKIPARTTLDDQAKALFRRFVGEPFAMPSKPKAPRHGRRVSTPTTLPDDMPPAWLLEVMQRSLGVSAGG